MGDIVKLNLKQTLVKNLKELQEVKLKIKPAG
jgi:hypothetical protein